MSLMALNLMTYPTSSEHLPMRYLEKKYFLEFWLGRQGSNLGMAASKAAALPLGDAPSAGGPTAVL